jgi:hypothetical protein
MQEEPKLVRVCSLPQYEQLPQATAVTIDSLPEQKLQTTTETINSEQMAEQRVSLSIVSRMTKQLKEMVLTA